MDFTVRMDHRVEIKEREKTDKYLNLARGLKNTVEHEGDGDTYCSWSTWNSLQSPGKKTGFIGDMKKNGDHPESSIVEISKNT